MPSARDLMQKADSLMRSNRSIGLSEADQTIPVLTDVVIPGDSAILRNDQTTMSSRVDPVIASPAHDTRPFEPQPLSFAAAPTDEDERAREVAEQKRMLAEEVYFEVLRDLDLESSDALRGRLAAELQPIFEQMSRDLIDRVEQGLSEAIRQQVASAIERKLEMRHPHAIPVSQRR